MEMTAPWKPSLGNPSSIAKGDSVIQGMDVLRTNFV